ncbi:PREDICTED: NADH dehydrogenase [ubiquinone] 1 alpha subcomplex assembly factor 3 [Polistes dominula]|uniref:NADH dehydrogenase [ubiquinone] 1 alpha subcomplex assembly factor 3 n=1 Tax=Polistes dominula TaxID=743375 RepID=A0ABM1J4M0_POLDO|nr:PREDICTED: NADH dehydrogenase [ubiquinone] 1 alpha subcomplex assembly factor 3 [Polistes dominula]
MRFAFKKLFNSKVFHNIRNLHLSQNVKGHSYEGPGKTTVTILNKNEQSLLLIDDYNKTGFTLNNGIKMIGPIIIFSKSLLFWNVASAKDINKDSLILFSILEPKLDLLIIGLDDDYDRNFLINLKETIKYLNINTEILPVSQACSIFNFVNLENRYVAAALIPPKSNSRAIFLSQNLNKNYDKSQIKYE